ncbi:MAG: hypothetical protein Q9165_008652 [Trypethelium subeluteriae]
MTENLTGYTPLESLLLFQSLASNGPEPSSFSRTSDLLNNNPHVRSAKAYDSGRLSPDALRELYLGLLKEEARAELDEATTSEAQESNGVLDGASRKRKRSPNLLSVQEASKHAHLIPQLIARLYARYREHTIREIREDERRYDALLQEVEDIQAGKWDERLTRQASQETRVLPHPPTRASRSPATPDHPSKQGAEPSEDQRSIVDATRASPSVVANTEPQVTQEEPNLAQAKIDAVINQPVSAATSENIAPSAAGSQAPSPVQQSTAQSDAPSHQPTPAARLPPPKPSSSGYRLNSPSVHQSPYAPSPAPPVPGVGISPGLISPHVAPDGRAPSSTSPVILPPPSGMPYFSPGSNNPPYSGPAAYSPQQYGQPPRYSASSFAPNEGQNTYAYPPNQYVQHAGRTPMAPPYPPQPGGIMLPPFQLDLQTSGRSSQQHPPSLNTPAARPYTQSSPTLSRAVQRPDQPRTLAAGPTPSQVKEFEHVAEMLLPKLPARNTKWRKLPQPPELAIPRSPTRPPLETLSPVKQRRPSPEAEVNVVKPRRQQRRTHGGGHESEDTKVSVEEHPSEAGTQAKHSRMRTRKARGGSVSSSAVASSIRGRTRSQSIISHAESSVQDNEPSSQLTVKPEPPSTPAGSGVLSDIAASESTPTEARVTRRRAGTLQSTVDTAQKRKRPAREQSESPPPMEMPPSSPGKQYISASRNFSRTSLTIMNDITSHKYASYFAQPVTERQAEGYHDIVYRGQDLRTIQKLINNGSKTIAGMISANPSFDASQPPLASPGGPSGGSGTVLVPANPNVMPPQAIVNSSQLEKEIMRMFANAVMFNPGEEGMVKETREMAEDVQQMVRQWRGAERTQTGTPVHSGARSKGDEEDEGGDEEDFREQVLNPVCAVTALVLRAVRSTTQTLIGTLNHSITNLITTKSPVDSSDTSALVLQQLQEQSATSSKLSQAVLARVPYAVSGVAQGLTGQINATIERRIIAF